MGIVLAVVWLLALCLPVAQRKRCSASIPMGVRRIDQWEFYEEDP